MNLFKRVPAVGCPRVPESGRGSFRRGSRPVCGPFLPRTCFRFRVEQCQHVHALQPLPELFLDFCLQMPQTRVVPVVQVVAFVPVDLCRGAHGEPFVEEVHQVVHSHPFDPFAEIDHARRGVTDVADDERVDYGFVE